MFRAIRETIEAFKPKVETPLISESDQKFISFVRSCIKLPDWSLAVAIRAYLGLDSLEEIKYLDAKEEDIYSEKDGMEVI